MRHLWWWHQMHFQASFEKGQRPNFLEIRGQWIPTTDSFTIKIIKIIKKIHLQRDKRDWTREIDKPSNALIYWRNLSIDRFKKKWPEICNIPIIVFTCRPILWLPMNNGTWNKVNRWELGQWVKWESEPVNRVSNQSQCSSDSGIGKRLE